MDLCTTDEVIILRSALNIISTWWAEWVSTVKTVPQHIYIYIYSYLISWLFFVVCQLFRSSFNNLKGNALSHIHFKWIEKRKCSEYSDALIRRKYLCWPSYVFEAFLNSFIFIRCCCCHCMFWSYLLP